MVVEANDSALGVGLCGLHRCLTALHLVAGSLGKEHRGIPSCRPHLAGAALSDVVQVPAMKEARATRSNMDFTGAGYLASWYRSPWWIGCDTEQHGLHRCREHRTWRHGTGVHDGSVVTRSNMDFTGAGSTVLGVMVPESMPDRLCGGFAATLAL